MPRMRPSRTLNFLQPVRQPAYACGRASVVEWKYRILSKRLHSLLQNYGR